MVLKQSCWGCKYERKKLILFGTFTIKTLLSLFILNLICRIIYSEF